MKKILVTGSSGLVGNAIKAVSNNYPYEFIFITRKDVNLIDGNAVYKMLVKNKPDYVLHMAAKVGGVLANIQEPATYFYENIIMNTNIIDAAYKTGVKKLIACSSICACPDGLEKITEDVLQDGKPFKDHVYYGYSKRMVDIQIQAYRKQFDVDFGTIIPGNMFGEHDNFNLKHGHVLPSLIHKCYLAKNNNTPLNLWGDGTQRRELIYSKDVAHIIIKLLELEKLPLRLLISAKTDHSTKEIANKIMKAMKYDGKIEFESNMPIGQQERHCDTSYLTSLFPDFKFSSIDVAIQQTVEWFVNNYPEIRQ
jgi:GDP-L-fucose synthase